MVLDDLTAVQRIDQSSMLKMVDDFPRMIEDAAAIASRVKLPKIRKIDKIVICGMGGSAIGGDVVAALLRVESPIPVLVNRSYTLPKFVDKDTLLFVSSYSGNTEETLGALEEGLKRKCQILSVTSGGKLAKIAQGKGFPAVSIPSGIQPRAALPYLLVPVLILLQKLKIINGVGSQVKEAVSVLTQLKDQCQMSVPSAKNPVKQIALKIYNRIPIVFSSSGTTEAAGTRLKCQFNENSKMTAIHSVLPELCHNEIVNLSKVDRAKLEFPLLILEDGADHPRVKLRIRILKELLKNNLADLFEIKSYGKSKLARILSLIYLGDYLSVYCALLRGEDPSPVVVIENLKKQLAKS